MAERFCDIENCGNEIPDGRGSKGGLPWCDSCLHARYYWRKLGPSALKARKVKLEFWSSRVDELMPHIGRLLKDAKKKVDAAHARARQAA